MTTRIHGKLDALGGLKAGNLPDYATYASPVAGHIERVTLNRGGHGVLAPNGKIYCPPSASGMDIVVIDPLNATAEILDCGTWTGWCSTLGLDGIVYCIPHGSTSTIMTINPETHEVNTSHKTGVGGNDDYLGCALHPNGKIYCIPGDATSIGVYDYVANTFDSAPTGLTGLPSGGGKWSGGCLAPNGKIYCAPYEHNSVLIINPSVPSVDYATISSMATYSNRSWRKGCLAQNGKIYFAPRNGTSVLIVDPKTDTEDESTISGLTGSDKYSQGVLAPNGKIYCLPILFTNALVIDPETDAIDDTTHTGFPAGIYKYYFSVLAPNGKIYSRGYGLNASKFVELTPGGIPILPMENLLSPYVNN